MTTVYRESSQSLLKQVTFGDAAFLGGAFRCLKIDQSNPSCGDDFNGVNKLDEPHWMETKEVGEKKETVNITVEKSEKKMEKKLNKQDHGGQPQSLISSSIILKAAFKEKRPLSPFISKSF